MIFRENKYDFQSNIKLKNYNLDINSKTVEYKNKKLKLTEKEIEIILFLNKDNLPKKVIDLQKNDALLLPESRII